ncbi:MAG: isoprenylcysteine carboxylmethyltransferase family protein [Acidobacteria bacterium]|nr:isoprenylcysteine carboxylmethyltransferase family protein [Acidobacteriota bacterium]
MGLVGVQAAPSARVARAFSAAGALAFLVSLAYFLLLYLTRFGAAAAGSDARRAVTSNVALFTLFALHHSVFARQRVRRWIARTVPAELERPLYVWIASLLFVLVCAWWRPVAGVAWQVDGTPVWGLRALQAAGIWLTLRSAAILDIRELAGLRRPDDIRPPAPAGGGLQASATEFKTTGPYGWVRHPIYTGWFLFVWAASPMTFTRLTFAAASCAYLLLAMPLEERTLRATSAGAYDRYAARVRRRLLPGVY